MKTFFDRVRPLTNAYSTSTHLVTFGSPKSTMSLSSSSNQPRSLSTSVNSETAKKRLWTDTPTSSSSGNTLSTLMSSCSPLQLTDLSETSVFYKPNISFSDDSVTANATVGNSINSINCNSVLNRSGDSSQDSLGQSSLTSLLNRVEKFSDTKKSPKSTSNFTSTQRQHMSPNVPDGPYKFPIANISRIPTADSSTKHGMFVDGVSLTDPSACSRPPNYTYVQRVTENCNGDQNIDVNNIASHSCHNDRLSHGKPKSPSIFSLGVHLTSPRKLANETQSTCAGDQYSLDDVQNILDQESTAVTHHDDDNTTTSGSYTINADDLCEEIDQLFFNDIVV